MNSIHNQACHIWHKHLLESPKALEYLHNRGINNRSIKKFLLGYAEKNTAWNQLVDDNTKNGFLERLYETGLFRYDGDIFTERITIPIIYKNDIRYVTSRTIINNPVKHLHQKGNILYAINYEILDSCSHVFLVEGPFDCITLDQNNIPSIGLLGAHTIGKKVLEKLKRKDVYVCFDVDANKTGEKAAIKLARKLLREGIESRIVILPENGEKEDVNSFFKKHTLYEFKQIVAKSCIFKERLSPIIRRKKHSTLDIKDVVYLYAKPKVSGNHLKILCPFHEDKDPSLVVYLETNSFFCPTPDTMILNENMEWKELKNLSVGQDIIGVDEYTTNHCRHLKKSTITQLKENYADCIEIITNFGLIKCTKNHLLLSRNSGNELTWKSCELKDGRYKLPLGLKFFFNPSIFEEDYNYKLGYFQGYSIGDGTFKYQKGQKSYPINKACYYTVTSKDQEGITYIYNFLKENGVQIRFAKHYNSKNYTYKGKSYQDTYPSIDTRKLTDCKKIGELLSQKNKSLNYKRGFIAGLFDAEGTCGKKQHPLGIYNSNIELLKIAEKYLKEFGFINIKYDIDKRITKDMYFQSIAGTTIEISKFLSIFSPKIKIKSFNKIFDRGIGRWGKEAQILKIKQIGIQKIIEIETSTKTFIANGFVSHNCFGCGVSGDAEKLQKQLKGEYHA
jgi:hypothetical protein